MKKTDKKTSQDFFTFIAENGFSNSKELRNNEPIPFDKKVCELKKTDEAPCKTEKRMDTKEELYEAVSLMREKYNEFLKNYAPELSSPNKRIYLREFILDGAEKIALPHYGGPVGNAVKTYETEFELSDFDEKAVYICFKGADYIAKVYINDVCVGMHEGFFSPFEFEITSAAKIGRNTLKIVLENDFIYRGDTVLSEVGHILGLPRIEGDKLYAATGLGYDDPEVGWHHCPPGMGLYGDVFIDIRNKVNITDLYIRPLPEEDAAEAWIEIENTAHIAKKVIFNLSLYGKNFSETVFENLEYVPVSDGYELSASYGKNVYKVRLPISDAKIWNSETPYLYELQVSAELSGELCDKGKVSFGMRSFTQDTQNTPKGMFYLNGEKIRLRGANTMGFEQNAVLDGDIEQLITDILIAKVCNMNYLRLTQRPVQDEVYEICDMLGMMTQTDLPLFSVMRRSKFCEGVRQAEEMIRMVRKHPCNIVVSYINEPYGNAAHKDRPHRHMIRSELEDFFRACDLVVHYNCPDCVIKHVDGDFEGPDHTEENCMPDFHTYNLWYGGSLPFGKMYRGYWAPTLPGWYYGCGEYGTEGLDPIDLMKRRYPQEWLKEPFNPDNVIGAQTGVQYAKFFDTPNSLEEWVFKSQAYQAFATKMATECLRRDPRMVSFAIHLFIDAWPAGWMKSIVDCERTPKPAYFEYTNALEPILVSLRSDRFTYFDDETVSIEAYVCNDTHEVSDGNYTMVFELYDGDKVIMQSKTAAYFGEVTATYIANAEFKISVEDRKKLCLKAILMRNDDVISYNTFDLEVFKRRGINKSDNIILIDDLDVGEHEIAGETVVVENKAPSYFASRDTGHPAVAEFLEKDFYMMYSKETDMIEYLITKDFKAPGFSPILLSRGKNSEMMAAGIKEYDGKKYVICLAKLLPENPVAERFL
ncbi:MAG: hypothetical protein IJB42_00715, partial [Oscillospiraceae bacterium]|nr:hypothetical protein [Oscillospiraceae bacterium]